MTQKFLNELTYSIVGSAIQVHKELGPGLLESVYEKCLAQCTIVDISQINGKTERFAIKFQLHKYL